MKADGVLVLDKTEERIDTDTVWPRGGYSDAEVDKTKKKPVEHYL